MSYSSNFNLNQRLSYLESISGNPVPTTSDLADVLINGNNAGANDIDMNNQDILQVDNIDLVTINGSAYPPAVSTLADVLLAGNNAGINGIDMNNNSINNVYRIEAVDTLTDIKNRIIPGAVQLIKVSTAMPYMALSSTDLYFSNVTTGGSLSQYGKTKMEITNLAGTAVVSVNPSNMTFYNPFGDDYSQLDINSLDFADATGTVVNTVTQTGMAITGAGTISATGGFTIPSTVDFTNAIAPTCIANPQSGLDLCNKNYVDSQAALTAYQLYFNESIIYTVPNGATYKELSPLQVPTPSTIAWTTNSTAPVLLSSFFNSLINLNIPASIPAGVWTLLLYANLSTTAGRDREAFFYELYGTTSLGAENLLYTSPASQLLTTVAPLIGSVSVQGTVPLTDLSPFTGLGIKLYIQSVVSSVTTGSIIYQTPNAYSSILTSFAVVQSPDLLNLNNTWTGTNNFTSTLIGNLTGTTTNLAGGIASQIPYQSSAGVTAFIPNGISGQVLTSAGTGVSTWNTLPTTIATATNLAGGIASQIPYQSSAGTTAFIPNGTSGQVLTSAGTGVSTWNTLPTTIATATNLANGVASQIPYQSSAGTTAFIPNGTVGQVLTSAGTAVPAWTTPSATTLANVLLAGNSAGATDINMNSRSINSALSVTSTTFTGALTGNASTATQSNNLAGGLGGQIPYQSALNTTALLPNGTLGQVLKSAGGTSAPTWGSAPAASLSAVMAVGASASTALNMATFAITSAGAIGTTSLTSSGNCSISGLMVGTGANNTINSNTALGSSALPITTTGTNNTAIGKDTLGTSNTTASNNTAIGYRALYGNAVSGGTNTSIGSFSGGTTSTGINNTYLGVFADQTAGTGTFSNSTAIGYNSKIIGSNQIQMGTNTESVVIPGYITSTNVSSDSVNFGIGAGKATSAGTQPVFCVAIGNYAGNTQQRNSVAVGALAQQTGAAQYSTALGQGAGNLNQGAGAGVGFCLAVGGSAGGSNQGQYATAVGASSGNTSQGAGAVCVGYVAGQTSQGVGSVAIGRNAGNASQTTQAVAIGLNAGQTTQGSSGVAIGVNAGLFQQGAQAIAIGINAGRGTSGLDKQGSNSIAIGNTAGLATQGLSCIAIGTSAGNATQLDNAVAIGSGAGLTSQGASAVALGNVAGNVSQGGNAVAIGIQAGQTSQGISSIAIGGLAGSSTQGGSAIAIGLNSGVTTQGGSAIAIGSASGNNAQGGSAIAIGGAAGQTSQGISSIAIGSVAGQTSQSGSAIAIGNNAGKTTQGGNAIAIGISAGTTSQGSSAIAIGAQAGNGLVTGQGANAIAIGNKAGESSQLAGSICLNASGVAVNPSVAGLYINPIRNDTTKQTQVQYNTTSKEVSYVDQVVSPVTTSGLDLTGSINLLSGTSGSVSGQHLVIVINGVTYKIELRNV